MKTLAGAAEGRARQESTLLDTGSAEEEGDELRKPFPKSNIFAHIGDDVAEKTVLTLKGRGRGEQGGEFGT